MSSPGPRAAAYLLAAIIAASFAYDLMRMPIQRFDALPDLLEIQRWPSVSATFMANLGGPGSIGGTALLRPLKFAQIKALFDLSDGHYWLAFRGFHAALLIAAVLLFVRALAVRTWSDFAAAGFGLTVLTGMYTFRGTVREAFPLNHNLEIVVLCLLVLNFARSRGGWLVDLAAAAALVAATLILESGVLLWVIIVAAWASGMTGISRRGVTIATVLLGAYMAARFFFLSVGVPGLADRNSGFLLEMLEGEELVRRFGSNPAWFYAYNVGASVMSVLFAEPQGGVFELVRGWLDGDVPPRLYIAVASSVATTILIVWAARRAFSGVPQEHHGDRQLFIVFAAVLLANAAVSFAYTKDEIMSPAGALYACAAFVAARHAIEHGWRSHRRVARMAVCLALCAVAGLWAFRSAGLHHSLRVQAFKHRNDWARLTEATYREAGIPADDSAVALVRQLRRDALDMRVPAPDLFGPWADRWMGE